MHADIRIRPEIDRALRIAADAQGVRTDVLAPAIALALKPLLADDRAANWHLSRLTADGYPFEVTFTTANDALRCTMEVAPPASPRADRIGQVRAVLASFDRTAPDGEATLAEFGRFQSRRPLAFGAWLGLRADAAGMIEVKLYVEVPECDPAPAVAWLKERLAADLTLPGRPKSLRMFGYVPATGTLEAYFSLTGLRPWEIGALMQPIGIQHRAREVLGCYEAVLRRHLHQALPSPIFGYSYALTAGRPAVFSLYAFTEHLFGTDGRTRRGVLAHLESTGQRLAGYEALSAPMADETEHAHGHGLFGVAVSGDGPPILHLGLRPPAGECGHA